MCQDCGCGAGGEIRYDGLAEPEQPLARSHTNPHSHPYAPHLRTNLSVPLDGPPGSAAADPDPNSMHAHPHEVAGTHAHHEGEEIAGSHRLLAMQRSILEKNDRLAEQNRGFFRAKKLLVLNVLSAPGSGKTAFIQKTVETVGHRLRMGVVVGDLATDCDSQRLRAAGIPVVQITTGTLCHLEAEMVARAAGKLNLDALDVLVIENVGNLVCPASYDLGERLRVVLLSVTEGEDKPLKYPPLFHSAHVAVVTKCDLAAAAHFDRQTALANLGRISHHARVFETSARTGEGMDSWCGFLAEQHKQDFEP